MKKKNDTYYGRKIIATIFDYSILFTLTYFWYKEFGEPDGKGGYSAEGIMALPPIVFWVILLPWSESLFSATIGHWLVGLRIIDEGGLGAHIGQTLKRRIADIVDLYFLGIPAIIAIERTPNCQRLGDLWARTMVVNKKDKGKITSG